MKVSTRNYITKTVSKQWAKDSRNNDFSMKFIRNLCDTEDLLKVDDESFVTLFSIVDEEAKVLYACFGRDELKAKKACKLYAEAGFVLGLLGTVPKGCEEMFETVISLAGKRG